MLPETWGIGQGRTPGSGVFEREGCVSQYSLSICWSDVVPSGKCRLGSVRQCLGIEGPVKSIGVDPRNIGKSVALYLFRSYCSCGCYNPQF